MNALMTKSDIEMTSLEISEVTGKMHKHIMADVRKETLDLGNEIGRTIFRLTERLDSQGRKQPVYEFGKNGAMQLALKYDAKTRYRVIKRIEELERNKPILPVSYKEALIQLVGQVEENERLGTHNNILTQQVQELKPKADYTDSILKNKGLVTIGQIAKDYGMSAQKMNNLLHELGIQYKQSGQWLLYSNHHDKAYTHSNTVDITKKDGSKDVRMNTKWSQKGRLFIYEILKSGKGLLPTIERSN